MFNTAAGLASDYEREIVFEFVVVLARVTQRAEQRQLVWIVRATAADPIDVMDLQPLPPAAAFACVAGSLQHGAFDSGGERTSATNRYGWLRCCVFVSNVGW